MATVYAYGNNIEWVDTGVTGACIIQAQNGDALIHFGTTLPTTYAEGKHMHLNKGDVPYYNSNTEDTVYVRCANNNVTGIKQICKIALEIV